MRVALLVFLFFGIFSSASGEANEMPSLLEDGIEAYQSAIETKDRNQRVGRFARAEALFARVAQQQEKHSATTPVNPDLYLNWGNAALGAEHLGTAVLAFRRALSVDSQNQRARQNLQHARSLLPEWIPHPEEEIAFGSFFDWVRHLRGGDWFGLAALAFLLSLIAAAIYIRTGSTTTRNVAMIIGVLWVALLVQGWRQNHTRNAMEAVVTIEEVAVRAADSTNAPLRFPQPLSSGSEVRVIEARETWVHVGLPDGREGWLPRSAIEFVQPS